MNQTDIKIFELIEILLANGRIPSVNAFCIEIGFLRQNIARVKQGKAHFTTEHVRIICKVYKVNASWIFNIDKKIFI